MFILQPVPYRNKATLSIFGLMIGKRAGFVLMILAAVAGFRPGAVYSQDTEGSMLYSTLVTVNPSLAGASGEGRIRLLYRDFYPGLLRGLATYSVSYDTWLEPVHGGVGVYITENSLGNILNDLRGGASYSYHLRAGRDWYVNAGFMASAIYRSYNRSEIILPDQIDPVLGPVLPSSENPALEPRLLFDVSVGFLVSWKDVNMGISMLHLARPDLTGMGRDAGRLPRRLTLHSDARFTPGGGEMSLTPLAAFSYQGSMAWGTAGLVLGYKVMTINMLIHGGAGSGIYSCQPGISVAAGTLKIGYQYYFSPGPAGGTVPFTQSNLVTLSAGLNNVDKRGVVKAIKYPEL